MGGLIFAECGVLAPGNARVSFITELLATQQGRGMSGLWAVSSLRALLEASTGVLSGSDARPEATLSRQLQQAGLRGEGVCDHRVWLVKSHWPERRGASAFLRRRSGAFQ